MPSHALALAVGVFLLQGSWPNTVKWAGMRTALFYRHFLIGWMLAFGSIAATWLAAGRTAGTFPTFDRADMPAASAAVATGLMVSLSHVLSISAVEMLGLTFAALAAGTSGLATSILLSAIVEPSLRTLPLAAACAFALGGTVICERAWSQPRLRGGLPWPKPMIVGAMSGAILAASMSLAARATAAFDGLTPLGAFTGTTIGLLMGGIGASQYLMARPIFGPPVRGDAEQGRQDGRTRPQARGARARASLGGVMAACGTAAATTDTLSAHAVLNYTLGYLAPVLAAAWGLLAWREHRSAGAAIARAVVAAVFLHVAALTTLYSAATSP